MLNLYFCGYAAGDGGGVVFTISGLFLEIPKSFKTLSAAGLI